MESRPFNSDAHETSDYDDDSDDSSFSRGTKKISPTVPARQAPPTVEQGSTAQTLFGVEKTEKPKAETSLFGEKPESPTQTSETAEGDERSDTTEAIEGLSSDETILVVQEYVAERSEVIETELEQSTPDGPAAAAATADKLLLQNIEFYMVTDDFEGEQTFDEALEAALQQTAQELGLPIETAAATQVMPTTEASIQTPDQGESGQDDDDTTGAQSNVQAATSSMPTNIATANNSPVNGQPNQLPTVPMPAHTPAPGGNNGGASPPPPRSPAPGGNPQPGGSGGGAGPNALYNPSYLPQTSPNVLSTSTVETDSQPDRSKSDFSKGLLVGGVAGYLIGKRRGRIKTEKRLTAATEKLQKEVTTLQDKVLEKEQQVRRLAAEKSIDEQAGKQAKAEKVDSASQAMVTAAEAPAVKVVQEQLVEKPPTEIAQQTPKMEKTVEKPTTIKQLAEKPPLTAKAVEQLPKNELLDVANTIVIEGTSLKKRFESGEIDEKALRRVVTEHIRTGGHAERQLKAEIAHAEQKASPEAVALKPAVGRRQSARSGAASQSMPHDIWESSMSVSNAQSEQPWRAGAAIDQHIRSKSLPPPRRSKTLGAGIGGITFILLALAIWYFVSH